MTGHIIILVFILGISYLLDFRHLKGRNGKQKACYIVLFGTGYLMIALYLLNRNLPSVLSWIYPQT